MKKQRTFLQARALHLERQRWYDLFRKLRAGEIIPEFHYRAEGKSRIAKNILPWDGGRDNLFYLVATCVIHNGRGRERGPRITELCWKDTGNPYLYGEYQGFRRHIKFGPYYFPQRITCPEKNIFGIVTGGVYEEGKCLIDPIVFCQLCHSPAISPSDDQNKVLCWSCKLKENQIKEE